MSTVARTRADGRGDDFGGEWHVYEPHKVGLPPLRAPTSALSGSGGSSSCELARTDSAGSALQHDARPAVADPQPGDARDRVLHPRLHHPWRRERADFLAHLMMSLFVFRLGRRRRPGARSVVGGGRLLLNTAFPRLILPLESVLEARSYASSRRSRLRGGVRGRRAPGRPASSVGDSDHRARSWSSPQARQCSRHGAGVFPRPDQLPAVLHAHLALHVADPLLRRGRAREARPILNLNPMYPMLDALNDAVIEGRNPTFGLLAARLAWAVATVVVAARSSSSPGSVSLRSASEDPQSRSRAGARSARWAVKVEGLSVTYRTASRRSRR